MTTASIAGGGEVERAIRAATDDDRMALAPFLTAGFPSRAGFADLLDAVGRHADLVEIGVPFSDPMADGVTIQASSRTALAGGVTLAWILESLGARTRRAPLVLMSYLNPLLAYGLERLAHDAREAGVSCCIVPDLPLEESLPIRARFDAAGLGLVQLVTPVTPPDRTRVICAASRGFVYAVTMTGTTGGRTATAARQDYFARVRAASTLPVLAGFGIRGPEQMKALGGRVDGAIVGSALIEVLERGDDPVPFLQGLRAASRDGRSGS